MRDGGIAELVASLVGFDPDVAQRDELGVVLGDLNRVAGWVEHARVRVARRLRELNAEGRSEAAAGMASMDVGRRSGKEATATVERSDLHAVADELLASASADWVSESDRRVKRQVEEIKQSHRPDGDVEGLGRQREQSHVKRWTERGSGMKMTLLALDPVRDATFHAAVDAQLARLRQDEPNAKRPFAQLHVDAVVAAVGAGSPGQRIPEIVVHIDRRSLTRGRHPASLCETEAGVPLPVATVQRMCCEAVLTTAIVDADGTVGTLGGEIRTANREQRRALAAMHRTCAHPHCTVSFEQCRIHHIVWCSRGGATVLVNLLPLCEIHHHLVHEGEWTVTMTPDRVCTWIRPDGTIWTTAPSIDRARPRPTTRPSDRAGPVATAIQRVGAGESADRPWSTRSVASPASSCRWN